MKRIYYQLEIKNSINRGYGKYPRYQGAGSSTINPYKIENAYNSFKENNIAFDYAKDMKE